MVSRFGGRFASGHTVTIWVVTAGTSIERQKRGGTWFAVTTCRRRPSGITGTSALFPSATTQIVIDTPDPWPHTEAVLFRLRTLVQVAAAVAAAMMLGACTTGHARADRPSASSATAAPGVSAQNGSSTTSTQPNYRAEFTARPLHLPVVGRGQACPTSGGTPIDAGGFGGVAQGKGPVHPIGADTHGDAPLISTTQSPGWLAFKSLWFSEPGYQGPFLVRIRRIDGGGPAGLLDDPQVTSFYVPAGPTVNGADGYREQPGATWVKTPGCLAWQVDGLTFSHVIVVRALCRPPYCVMPSTSTATVERPSR